MKPARGHSCVERFWGTHFLERGGGRGEDFRSSLPGKGGRNGSCASGVVLFPSGPQGPSRRRNARGSEHRKSAAKGAALRKKRTRGRRGPLFGTKTASKENRRARQTRTPLDLRRLFYTPQTAKKKQLWAAPPAEALGPEGVPRKRGGFGPAANAPFSTVWRAAPFTIACPHPETRKRHQSMGTNEGGTESAPGMRPPRPRAKPPIFSSKPAPPPSAFIAAPRGKFQKAKSKKKKLHLENRKRSPCTYILGEGGGAQNPPENEPHSWNGPPPWRRDFSRRNKWKDAEWGARILKIFKAHAPRPRQRDPLHKNNGYRSFKRRMAPSKKLPDGATALQRRSEKPHKIMEQTTP